MNELENLHTTLQRRATPQEIAASIVKLGTHDLTKNTVKDLTDLARHSSYYTSMSNAWKRHPGLQRAYTSAWVAMENVTTTAGLPGLDEADPTSAASLQVFVEDALLVLGFADTVPQEKRSKTRPERVSTSGYYSYSLPRQPHGARGEGGDRVDVRGKMDAATRKSALPGVSVRAYRRAVSTVAHLQQRTTVLAREQDREACVAFGKSRLAHTIGLDDFTACPETAAFVAYYTARLGLRTLFTNTAQDRPMDTVAEDLLARARKSATYRPDVVARVLTRPSILADLSATQQGELLGTYYQMLTQAARSLENAFGPQRDETTMTVRRGDDSSTWNAASRAFNQARTGWLNLTVGMGLGDLVEKQCFGKVPALIAADVAAWHTDTHTDTFVWAELPKPWDVILHGTLCTADDVRDACKTHKLDPDATGWTQPYRQSSLEKAIVAPELVHGVIVSSPELADLLKSIGAYSGQAPSVAQEKNLADILSA